jgi:hypothetical protein
MAKPFDANPMIKMWVTIIDNGLLIQQLHEYMNLVEIVVVLNVWINGR